MKKEKILLIDIGNTNTLIGLTSLDSSAITSFRFETNKKTTIDDFSLKLDFVFRQNEDFTFNFALVSSVVPELNELVRAAFLKYRNVTSIFINDLSQEHLALKINYANPLEIGADRLVNAVAAKNIYGYPVMIVDIGTAATIDILDFEGSYIGGAILPGIGMTVNALSLMTSKLPKIDFKKPASLIGKDTSESIQSGIYHGFLGSIEFFKAHYLKDNNLKEIKVILTGGYTEIYEKELNIFDIVDQDLTLKGLEIIYSNLPKSKIF